MAQGQLGVHVDGTRAGVQDSSTAISRGHVVVLNSATDVAKVVRASSANQVKVAGVARYDCAGQNKDLELLVRCDGPVLNTSGSSISQGDTLISDASGGVKTRAAESAPFWIVGEALEDAAAGDLFMARIAIRKQL